MQITVLAGGLSPEREVSLTSGTLIANALIEKGHKVLLLDVYLGISPLPEDLSVLFQNTPYPLRSVGHEIPDLAALKETSGNGGALIGPGVISLCRRSDAVFLALHGAMGENGQLQATLDSFGIRYTGSGYDGSLLAMDKDLSKRLLRGACVRTPDWIYFNTDTDTPETALSAVGLPCVVKPVACGSSVGVSLVYTEEELKKALGEAAKWDRRVLVERLIEGRELTVGILGDRVLPAVEIIPESRFYDYQNKYQGTTREICPAELDESVVAEADRMTRRGFAALRLSGYARFDYILDRKGALWCLEANTLPGMTPTSLLPQEAAAIGLPYPDLCEEIIRLSQKKA